MFLYQLTTQTLTCTPFSLYSAHTASCSHTISCLNISCSHTSLALSTQQFAQQAIMEQNNDPQATPSNPPAAPTNPPANPPATLTPAQEVAALKKKFKRKLRKVVAMREQTPMLVSPATETQAKGTLSSWDSLFTGANPTQRLKDMYANLRNCLMVDSKYGHAVARLHQLELDLFRVKYEEYLYVASAPQEVQDAAGQLFVGQVATAPAPCSMPGWRDPIPGLHNEELEFFMTQEWSAIMKRLEEERIARLPPASDRPYRPKPLRFSWERPKPWERSSGNDTLLHLCSTLGRLRMTSTTEVVEMIEEYVDRTTKCKERSRILDYASRRWIDDITGILETDLRYLDSVPQECYEHVPALRQAMGDAVARLLEVHDEWGVEHQLRLGRWCESETQW